MAFSQYELEKKIYDHIYDEIVKSYIWKKKKSLDHITIFFWTGHKFLSGCGDEIIVIVIIITVFTGARITDGLRLCNFIG